MTSVDLPEFAAWFGESKVVDAAGEPMVVYHGTNSGVSSFEGAVFFTDSAEEAAEYGDTVVPAYVRITKPKRLDSFDQMEALQNNEIERYAALGYDGFIGEGAGGTHYVAFRPEQIKSAGNVGPLGFRPVTEAEAAPLGMTAEQANEAQGYGDTRFHRTPVFYSAALRAVEEARGAPKRAGAATWIGWLDGAVRRGDMRQSERNWLGIDAWLEAQGRAVTRGELASFLRSSEVQFEEVMYGGQPRVQLEWTEWSDPRDDDLGERYCISKDGNYRMVMDVEGRIDLYDGVNGDVIREGLRDVVRAMEYAETDAAGGGTDKATRFPLFRTPGGVNYRELLLKLPVREADPVDVMSREQLAQWYGDEVGYSPLDEDPTMSTDALRELVRGFVVEARSANSATAAGGSYATYDTRHWEGERNVLVHVRFDERVDTLGKRVLFIQEIQSDWHQTGRRKGYGKQGTWRVLDECGQLLAQQPTEVDATTIADQYRSGQTPVQKAAGQPGAAATVTFVPDAIEGVPNAPFKRTDEWAMVAVKRMARWAVDHGFDRIAWATGEQIADLFDLTRQVREIKWRKHPDGLFDYEVTALDGRNFGKDNITAKQLADNIGKEHAERIASERAVEGVYSGLDLKVGGAGMRVFYDQILPAAVGKWVKPFGARVDGNTVTITPAMRDAVTQGQPAFRRGGSAVPAGGMSRELVAAIAREFIAAYKGFAPLTIRIGTTQEDLYGPDATIERQGVIKGGFHGELGVLTLASANLRDRADVVRTIRHEVIGHYGLACIADKDRRALLRTLIAARQSPGIDALWQRVDTAYADRSEMERAEEVFAMAAEQPFGSLGAAWNAVLVMLARGLRRAGMLDTSMTLAEVHAVAGRIERGVRLGRPVELGDALPQGEPPEPIRAQLAPGM